jgi:transposase InsO family protein
MSDHGCQPTSTAFMRAGGTLGIPQAFTSDHNPKGNADTERVIRTLNEEGLWWHEWTCPFTVASALEAGIADDNERYLHSALGYKPPRQLEREYHLSHGTQFVAA